MRTRSRNLFTTVHTEGGLLPADLLARIVQGHKQLDGLTPAAYHLADTERLAEAVGRSWTRLRQVWAAFRESLAKLPENDLATSLTRERWLLILFQELGYGRLQTARDLAVDGQSYPISHIWQRVPLHLVGARVDLDSRTPGAAGAARMSPHGLVQDFLNKSDDHSWGFVSNGRRLRLLRDNASMTRQAFVEFDLEAMFNGEVYPDFALLWLLAHQSRLEGEKLEDYWLERWAREAREIGTRALDALRGGVEEAIRALGRGFLAHPKNTALKAALRSGTLGTQDYYRELLRLVYRLIFLFAAEDRRLLFAPNAPLEAKDRYARHYSTERLRRLAERVRGSQHGDHWEALRLVMGFLGSDEGCPALALPALGSFLWSHEAIGHLADTQLANVDLLDAVRALSFTSHEGVRRPVDYKSLGAEELGSVYESLLELHPVIDADRPEFTLSTAAGHERKTTGSYYTPDSLVQCLLDSALVPVLDEAARKPNPEQAILALKVCDPACGSGHFLIAAAHRIARRLASVRTGDVEPSPDAVRAALRDVIGHCIYGVDLNPMAVELCKVSLWLESIDPGKPLSFLDHRILVGNSLLGATPALIEKGIPDVAFEQLDGDDAAIVRDLRRRNRDERRGQSTLYSEIAAETAPIYGSLEHSHAEIEAIEDHSLAGVRRKEQRFRDLQRSRDYAKAKLIADAWCAPFVAPKTRGTADTVTHAAFQRLVDDPDLLQAAVQREVARLAARYGFFHWHLEYPEVFHVPASGAAENDKTGWSGGFDVLLGNPPWDTLSPDAKEFFSAYDPQIRFQSKDEQEGTIARLEREPAIGAAWAATCRSLYSQVHFFKQSGRYELFAPGNLGKGDFNVYRMFVETGMHVVRRAGRLAQFVPENLYNGANAMAIRRALFDRFHWTLLLGFENAREVWFRDIDTRTKFCLYSANKGGHTESIAAAFNIRSMSELRAATSGQALRLPVSLIEEFSPDALAIMELSSQRDIDIATRMYAAWPKFGDETAGPPHRDFAAEIHMGNDRERFSEDPRDLPLYEGRMVDAFDHRAKAYRSGRGRAAVWEELPFDDSRKAIVPQWHVSEAMLPAKLGDRPRRYRLGFCDVGSPTNERTLFAALIPPNCVSGDTVPTITFEHGDEWAYMVWLAVANSFAMDFLVRKKVSLHVKPHILDSLPFPRLSRAYPGAARIVELGARLTCTSREMLPYWDALAQDGWLPALAPNGALPGLVDEEGRASARAELDAIVARDLFGLSRDELVYILDTFPIVRERDIAAHGTFRMKDLILAAFSHEPRPSLVDAVPYRATESK